MIISWFSCGCSSFVASYLMRDKLDKIIYTKVDEQHEDSERFLHDCEKYLDKKIDIVQSPYFHSIYDVFRSTGIIKVRNYVPCTNILKIQVRKDFERLNTGKHTYVWGFDCTEKKRAERVIENNPDQDHVFPLIEANLDKSDVHAICNNLGLKRPIMYDLGYPNNNCVGCIRGSYGYWNKIRIDFPYIFNKMAKLERELNHSVLRDCYLDELPCDKGLNKPVELVECGILCNFYSQ